MLKRNLLRGHLIRFYFKIDILEILRHNKHMKEIPNECALYFVKTQN